LLQHPSTWIKFCTLIQFGQQMRLHLLNQPTQRGELAKILKVGLWSNINHLTATWFMKQKYHGHGRRHHSQMKLLVSCLSSLYRRFLLELLLLLPSPSWKIAGVPPVIITHRSNVSTRRLQMIIFIQVAYFCTSILLLLIQDWLPQLQCWIW